MKIRDVLLGFASGAVAAYAVARAIEATRPMRAISPNPQTYGRLRRALTVADVARSAAATIAFAYGPPSRRVASAVEMLPRWARPAAFAAISTAASSLLEAPVEFTEGYRIERRYGLTEQPVAEYLADSAKSTAIEVAVTAVLATLADAILTRFPRTWPWLASGGALALYALANIVVPMYILPIFNRFERLEGPLEMRLRALATRYGVGDAEILTMNMSKQTKKANAFVAGIGRTHRIVLGDTLLDHFESDEIEFVIAHELGHYVSRDTWRLIAAAEIATVLLLMLAARFDSSDPANEPVRLARLAAVMTIGTTFLRPALAAFSRSREWAADRFALQATQDPHAGVRAFGRLRDQNLAEEDVPDWYEFFFGSHPSLGKRIAALRDTIDDGAARNAR